MEESLRKEDNLLTVARKLTMLHDCSDEVGGGGFCGMHRVPELRQALGHRLIQELDSLRDPMKNKAFLYVFNRITVEWDDLGISLAKERGRIPKNLKGNALLKRLIELSLS